MSERPSQVIQLLPGDFLNLALRELPAIVRSMLEAYPGQVWVAGGFIRDVISGFEPKDIDVFSRDENAMKLAIEWVKNSFYLVNIEETPFTVTLTIKGSPEARPQYRIQFVDKIFAEKPEDTILDFDFTNSQVAIMFKDGDCGFECSAPNAQGDFVGYVTEAFAQDVPFQRARYLTPYSNFNTALTVKRMAKFLRRGWDISDEDVQQVIAHVNSEIYGGTLLSHMTMLSDALNAIPYTPKPAPAPVTDEAEIPF